jgi:hypothetical protein
MSEIPMYPDELSVNRTGDVLKDAANDIQSDWPWYADAIRTMHDCLKSMAESPGEMGDRAREAIRQAELAAQGGPT